MKHILVTFKLFSPFSPIQFLFFPSNLVPNSHPPASSPHSYNSRLGRAKPNTCFLRDTWSQPKAPVRTTAHAVSQCSVTQSEESAIHPLHTWARRCLWLAIVAVTDQIERVCHPSHQKTIASVALLASGYRWLCHCQEITSSEIPTMSLLPWPGARWTKLAMACFGDGILLAY